MANFSNTDDTIDSCDIENEIVSLESDIEDIEDDINNSEIEIVKLKDKIEMSDDDLEIEDLQTEITDLELELEDQKARHYDLNEELKPLQDLKEELSSYSNWEYGITLINEDYFTEYAQELAEDIGAINKSVSWPYDHINWDDAAAALKQDYASIDYDGNTYWIRK